ncbi:MAG: hypothetical protein CMH32_03865 [Micavibrio sp.]|nr:hypothetical protein [Micavibrio sp.]HCK32261.1 DUF1467 domain-containing protein [Rhodospirillaceae bacterium]|tara:strand:+ start:42 stop:311 length:270 start_codon:yes stop_codon:yes gene_type:complete
MDIFTAIIVYLIIWWVVLFAVLPWGVKPPADHQTGNVSSAPDTPDLKKKFIITSVIAAIFLALTILLINLDVIDFREISNQLFKESMSS